MDDARVAPGAGAGVCGAEAPERLAEAARRVVDAIVEVVEPPGGEILRLEREALSVALGADVSWKQFAAVVAESLALGWAETGGREVELPGPLRPVEAVWMRPGSESVAAALEALRQVAGRSRAEAGPGDSHGDLYESFLRDFDPEARARSSVYLTPQPLVRMLVRSVDELLRDRLGMSGGLGSPEVSLLDPAAGTGAFLLAALQVAEEGGQGRSLKLAPAGWWGFELQPGAYVAAELRLARWRRAAESSGWRARSVDLHFGDALADDSPLAQPSMRMGSARELAQSTLVVLGNPPWSRTRVGSWWMETLLREGFHRRDGSVDDGYFCYQGRPVGTRNPKWLKARYVQFLRLAQRCVDGVGRGVVALVLPEGIADNLTFAGLRESLLGSFEEIFLLDLGGSSRKMPVETGPDENVFGVRQGVCAVVLVKGGSGRTGVFRAQVRGRRRQKLAWLTTNTFGTIDWQRVRPARPGHMFVSGGSRTGEGSYWQAPSIPEIFEVGSIGVITGRDALVVGFGERELAARIGMLRQADGDGRIWEVFGVKRSPQLERALGKLTAEKDWERHLVPYLFRPGDRRCLFSASYLVARPRTAVMSEVRRPGNVALLLPRRRRVFPSAWATDCTASHRVASAYEGSHAFPLYVAQRQPNVTSAVLDELSGRYGSAPAPEEVFGYVYWQLWSRAFHERYFEALRQDWPRVLFPHSLERFSVRARLGWQLARIHLGWERAGSRSWLHGDLPVRLPGEGKTFRYESEGRLHLGLGSGWYLAPVGREVMTYTVGGYRVIPGWIHRRAGRRLGAHDIEDLCRLIATVDETLELRREATAWEEEGQ